mmetsp:Transcript_18367/g.50638  ORF Transcript_18367/g.50638 Transcript_18367/m.50638 type:complete len:457 (+) Transcript_18367:2-1372(+)
MNTLKTLVWGLVRPSCPVHGAIKRRALSTVSPKTTTPSAPQGSVVPGEVKVADQGLNSFALADTDPKNHRPGDEGKIFKLNKDELKKVFPETLAGGFQRILFGRRRPPPVKVTPHWLELVKKDQPGFVIRKQAIEILSTLHCLSKQGVKDGKPAINCPGFLLDGAPGTGKSTILNHCVHWARSSGEWIVVFVPDATYYVDGVGVFQRDESGREILQASHAMQLLQQIINTNREKLAALPTEGALAKGGSKNVAEAIDNLLGMHIIQREEAAVSTCVNVLDALRTQTKFPVLLAIDEINALCGPSKYRDLEFQPLPASAVVLARALGRFQDAGFARGVVVGAATRTGEYSNIPLPSFGARKPLQVRGLSREEMRAYLAYMNASGDLFAPVTKELLDYLQFVTAGRPRDVEYICSSELFNVGQNNAPKNKKVGKFFARTFGGYDGMILPPTLPPVALR